jgi:beta-galactosidase
MKRCPRLLLGLAGLGLGLILGAPAAGARERIRLDPGWRFHLGDAPGAEQPGYADAGWRVVNLPHDWSIEGAFDPHAPGDGGGDGFLPTGLGWYRRHLDVPAAWAGRQVMVEFEGVYENAEVWINGHDLGLHPYGYTSFWHDLTPYLRPGADNVLAVRVDNSQQPNTRWYSGSGIYRHVWLVVTDPVHVAPWGVFVSTTRASPDAATVRVAVTVRNDSDAPVAARVETRLQEPRGRTVAAVFQTAGIAPHADTTVTGTAVLPHPGLWSPDSPVLYDAVTQVQVAGRATDAVTTPFGVRTIAVSAAHGFELNGRTLKLVGGSVHCDNGPLGAAAFDRAEERRVALLKAAGFNAVRTAHNPPSPAFLAACDRLGLLVIDEAFDCWAQGKTAHDYHTVFADWWRRDLDSMVRRDRNHPSVVFWSIGNEVYERGTPEGAAIARQLTACIRALDPTRPLTAGLNGLGPKGDWTRLDPVFATLDVAGYNYELARAAADHARRPARVILATESYQSEAFANWAIAAGAPYVIGDFVWSAMDYLGEAGIGRVFPPGQAVVKHWEGDQWPWHGAYCGDIDLTGWRKPSSHYRAIVWNRGEKLYAAVEVPTADGRPWNLSPWSMPPARPDWTWPGDEGRPLTVEVASRYDAVRLYLNGRLLGEKPTTRAEEFKADFTVPYAPGTLEAVGVAGGRERQRFLLATAGPAARLRLDPARPRIRADGQDLAFVTVEVTDRAGRRRFDADPEVQFTLTGPGVIAGIGTGDMTTLESYQADPHRLFQGRALVVIRSTTAAGRLTLTASAPGFPDATAVIRARAVP